jgi:hypothetical protein
MPAAYSNLYIEQGTTFSTTIAIDDVYGDIFDLTNFTVISQIRKSYYSANTTSTFTSSINSSQGTITLGLTSAATANIASGRYVYDTKLVGINNGQVTRILEGVVEVSPSVTR